MHEIDIGFKLKLLEDRIGHLEQKVDVQGVYAEPGAMLIAAARGFHLEAGDRVLVCAVSQQTDLNQIQYWSIRRCRYGRARAELFAVEVTGARVLGVRGVHDK